MSDLKETLNKLVEATAHNQTLTAELIKNHDKALEVIRDLRVRVAILEWLVDELEEHEGAEKWSDYLRNALDYYDKYHPTSELEQ